VNNIVNVTHPAILRAAGQHQTDAGLLWVPPKMRTWTVGGSTVDTGSYHEQCGGGRIMRFELHNRSAGAAAVGLGFRWQDWYWRGGRLSAADVWAEDSVAYKARTPVLIGVDGADQGGFCVMSKKKFSWVSFDVTTAEVDAGAAVPDHAVQYSDAAGTGWTTAAAASTLTDSVTTTNVVWAAGAHNFVWEPPTDWGVSAALSATIPNGYYVMAFRSADREAGDTAGLVTGVELGSMLTLDQLAANNVYANEDIAFDDPWADGMVAYFSVADGGNRVYAEVYAIG
jgi:hypothetical protein